jgi:ribosomal protein L40E
MKPKGEREDAKLVYCTKCGTRNEDTAEFCMKCGASLQTGTVKSQRYERRRAEGECFGLPHGGAIAAIVIGVLILLGGFFALAQQQGWITRTPDLGWLVIIIIGILLIAGAIYRMRRRP